jgi:hypothetical protein
MWKNLIFSLNELNSLLSTIMKMNTSTSQEVQNKKANMTLLTMTSILPISVRGEEPYSPRT